MLSDEQASKIKDQLIEGIKLNYPKEKQEQIISEINSMEKNQLQDFLNKSNLSEKQPEIFRMIIEEKITSHKIEENDDALAVLEINPISKGHALIIPKKQIKDPKNITPSIKEFSKNIAEKIKNKFNPKKVEVLLTTMYGEVVINLLPIYNNENMESDRTKLENNQAEDILKELREVEIKKENSKHHVEDKKDKTETKKKETISSKNTWLPKRIP